MKLRRDIVIALAVASALVELPAIGTAILLRMLHPSTLRQRIVSEIQHATGREVSASRVTLKMLPDLTIDADDLILANPAGFSRPAMLTARHARVAIALLPLLGHRLVIRQIALDGIDLHLEHPPGQPPNWRFDPARASAALPRPLPAGAAPRLQLASLTILGVTATGTVSWRTPGSAGAIDVPALRLIEVNASSTIDLAATATLAGAPVTLRGKFGGQTHLWDTQDRSDWPVEAQLAAPDGAITVNGSITRPRALAGYDLTIAAHGADLGRLFSPWPQLGVPRLSNLALQTRLIDRLDSLDIPHLAMTAGPSDLSALMPGLRVEHVAIAAPNIDGTNGNQTNTIALDGQYAGQALALQATVGPVGRLFGQGSMIQGPPVAIDATAQAAGAAVKLQGRLQPAGDWAGTDATLHAGIPDLAALSSLAGRALPHLTDLYLDGTIQSGGGLLSFHDFHFSAPQAELQAAGAIRLGGTPRYSGSLHIARLDLDALLPEFAAPAPPDSAPGNALPPHWLIPDWPLPVGWLTGLDASLSVDADALRFRGVDIAAVVAPAVIHAQRLDLGPATATIGAARLTGSLSMTAGAAPTIAITLTAPGLNAASLSALLGVPDAATGQLDLSAALTGSGATAHALAGSLAGSLALALIEGSIGNRPLLAALSLLTPTGQLGLPLPSAGRSTVECLATRLTVHGGVATPDVFLLAMNRLRLAAAGTIDLGQETLDLRLRPYLEIGGAGLVLPSTAAGPWRTPTLALEPAGRGASPPGLALADSGDCASALAMARSVAPPPPAAAPPRRHSAVDLLKRLFRRPKP